MSQSSQGGWSLSRDGILWKKVSGRSQTTRDHAASFVKQLEESVGPVNFLGGLLLDRIATNCLRQQVLLEAQSVTAPNLTVIPSSCGPIDQLKQNVTSLWFVALLRYESFLNQTFHRDLILLQMLQKAHTVGPSVSSKKPPQSERSLNERPADVAVACQGIGAPKEIELSPVPSPDRVEQDAEDQEKDVNVEDDPRYPGRIDLD